MIISRTPFRISFFGGGTDYPAWYRINGGQVIATTIDKHCYLSCRWLPPVFDYRYVVTYSKIEHCRSLDEMSHPAVRGILRHLKLDNRGLSIVYAGDLPSRSGMGSSSAFTVGLLHALYGLKGEMPSKQQLAEESIYLEQEVLKETVGSQDQVLAAIGGLKHIIFQPDGKISVRPVTISRERLHELESHLMLFYTGFTRTASAIAASFVPDLHNRELELRRFSQMVEEGISILTSGRDLRDFGSLLHEFWQVKQRLSPLVSNSEIGAIYEAARAAGAVGGKLLGAGGGGFMLLFVPTESHAAVRRVLNNLIYVPFRFESVGSQIIFYEPDEEYTEDAYLQPGRVLSGFREFVPDRIEEI